MLLKSYAASRLQRPGPFSGVIGTSLRLGCPTSVVRGTVVSEILSARQIVVKPLLAGWKIWALGPYKKLWPRSGFHPISFFFGGAGDEAPGISGSSPSHLRSSFV